MAKKYQNVTQRHEVRQCHWANGANRLAQCRVATNLQFVKIIIIIIIKETSICIAQ